MELTKTSNSGKVIALLGLAGLVGTLIVVSARRSAALPEEVEEEELVEVINATLRSGNVYWAALTDWERVHTRYPNEWPRDTDITFVWTIKNIGDVGAYFQVYIVSPGDWLYLDPGDEMLVDEDFHTPVIPVIPGYNYYHINILGRKLSGERIGAVWTSDEIEVTYV